MDYAGGLDEAGPTGASRKPPLKQGNGRLFNFFPTISTKGEKFPPF